MRVPSVPLILSLHASHGRHTHVPDTKRGVMRKLIPLACLGAVSAVLVGAARGAEPEVGRLSVERGKGQIVLDVRGAVLGRFTNGAITITDRSPNDPYVATVTGRRLVAQRRLGPAKVFFRGQGLRFRMLGGSYRIVIRASGIALSVVGRGLVLLDGEPRLPGDDLGVYSLDGVDCSLEPQSCDAIPDDPVRMRLEAPSQEQPARPVAGAR